MSGLRARQKADRNQRIIAAAADLFRARGYDRTKLEAIAAASGVSVGTVYNYYENKGDLLLAIVALEVSEVLDAGARVIDRPSGDIEVAMADLMSIYLDHSLVWLSKDMWREAMAIAIRRPETVFGQSYIALDARLQHQICTLVCKLRDQGRIHADTDAAAVGEMFFNNMNMMFTHFIRDSAMTVQDLKQAVSRQNRTLAAAIRKS